MKTIYQCDHCGRQFHDLEMAQKCEANDQRLKDSPPLINVGDFVLKSAPGHGYFGWIDGDPTWAIVEAEDDKQYPSGRRYNLIYVVTAITWEVNRLGRGLQRLYHLETKAMTKESGYNSG